MTGELEREFLDVWEAGTESDEVTLLAEDHVYLFGWIGGGAVDVGLAGDGASGVGQKVAVDDGCLGVDEGMFENQIPERMSSINSGGSAELSMIS